MKCRPLALTLRKHGMKMTEGDIYAMAKFMRVTLAHWWVFFFFFRKGRRLVREKRWTHDQNKMCFKQKKHTHSISRSYGNQSER